MEAVTYHYSKAYSQYGASMGRHSFADPDCDEKLHLSRVPARDGGDYDPGGAYWGGLGSNPLFVCWSNDGTVELFVRAQSRDHAKQLIKATWVPKAKFYR